MAARTITPLIATQAITLVLATGASVAWTVTELRNWHAQVDVPQQTLRDIETHSRPHHDLRLPRDSQQDAQARPTPPSGSTRQPPRLGNLVPSLRSKSKTRRQP